MKILFLSPIVTAMCIYIAVMYSLLYTLFTTYKSATINPSQRFGVPPTTTTAPIVPA
jgi:hypothetical protein